MKNKLELMFKKSTITELSHGTMLKVFGGIDTDNGDNGNTILVSTGRCSGIDEGDDDDDLMN